MADLLDVDSGLEGSFLGVVALEPHAMLAVPYGVCSDGWVVATIVSPVELFGITGALGT